MVELGDPMDTMGTVVPIGGVAADPPAPRVVSGTGWPGDESSVTARRKMQAARDNLIDCEDSLLYVLQFDPSLQPVIDRVVALLMDVSHRADVMPVRRAT